MFILQIRISNILPIKINQSNPNAYKDLGSYFNMFSQ